MVMPELPVPKAGKVLVINTDPEIIRILDINLSNINMEVVVAKSGIEALYKLDNNIFDIVIMDTNLPDMYYVEICQQVFENFPTMQIPIILIGTSSNHFDKNPMIDEMITYHITKPFEPKVIVALVQGCILHKERMMNFNPRTGLHNHIQVTKEINRLINQQTNLAAIYITIHDMTALNKTYGYAQTERIINSLADIISETVSLFGNPADLAGHFSGSRFLIVSSPFKARILCRKIIALYNRSIKYLFFDKHINNGSDGGENSRISGKWDPNMSIHLAVVTNEKHLYQNFLEVIEAAVEQIEYLKQSQESNCYFDLKANGIGLHSPLTRSESSQTYKEKMVAANWVLDWFDFLIRELSVPINNMNECIHIFESLNENILSSNQRKKIKGLQEQHNHLKQVIEDLTKLARYEEFKSGTLYEEVDVRKIFEWVLKQVEKMAEELHIKIDVEEEGSINRILRDKKSLTRSMLYIIRSAVRISPPQSTLHISLYEKNQEYIYIRINNREHYISTRVMKTLFQRQPVVSKKTPINELYPARILLHGLGGELDIISEKVTGTTYLISLPQKNNTGVKEVDKLQLDVEISRKAVKEALKNIQSAMSSKIRQMPSDIKYHFERLGEKIQELAVLCNKSLYLADDYNVRLESQQDRLLQQETAQGIIAEAILTICRDINAKQLFDLKNCKRVAKDSLTVAQKLNMSDVDRQILYHAALFKDLALAFTQRDMGDWLTISNRSLVTSKREHLHQVWKALSIIPFLTNACNIILYRWECFDGNGGNFGLKGGDIPLGSRILAVTDTFNYLTSEQSQNNKFTTDAAMKKIIENSGLKFDPDVVDAFLLSWKRKEIVSILDEI